MAHTKKRPRSRSHAFKKSKRQRTAHSGDNEPINSPQYQKWQRIGIFIAYLGTIYAGLQFQYQEIEKGPRQGKTHAVENDLVQAFESCQYIPDMRDKANRIGVNILRACRTDRGVHAAANMVALRIPPGVFEKIGGMENEDAEEENAGEDEQQEAPVNLQDTLLGETETKPQEQPKKQQRRKKSRIQLPTAAQLAEMRDNINAHLPKDKLQVVSIVPTHSGFNPRKHTSARYYRYLLPKSALLYKSSPNVLLNRACKNNVTEENVREHIDKALSLLVGSKSFHNYTNHKRAKSGADEAVRHVTSMEVIEELQGKEETYYVVQIYGQSFLYHQIRCMMGCVIAYCRGIIDEEIIAKSFDLRVRMELPIAPGHPLYLYQADFRAYNLGLQPEEPWQPLELNEQDLKRVQEFEHDRIQPEVFALENVEGKPHDDAMPFPIWIRQLEMDRRRFFQVEEIVPVENSGLKGQKLKKEQEEEVSNDE